MKNLIEIHENDTANSGYYAVWFTHNEKQQKRLCSEALVNSFLSMNQKEDFFMGKYKFSISNYDFNTLVNSLQHEKLTHKHEIIK